MESAASNCLYPEVLRFSSSAFDVQPTAAANAADETASNDAEYLDNTVH
jgi:hypothetical protein